MKIQLDRDTRERLARRAEQNEFDSTEKYIETILQVVVEELENQHTDTVQQRLEDLGYL